MAYTELTENRRSVLDIAEMADNSLQLLNMAVKQRAMCSRANALIPYFSMPQLACMEELAFPH